MTTPTRQEQAEAILEKRGRGLAEAILGRRATGSDDFAAAFNVERIDLIAAIPDRTALLALGRNVAGPRDGLYVIADGADHYRVYVQEKGEVRSPVEHAEFDEARDAVIDRVILLQGLPYVPPG
jgi:hypothetical protein